MKVPELIIHIGMHKTGTTSIQQSLHKHLNDTNYHYIKLNTPNHSRQIFTLFEEKRHPSILHIPNDEFKALNRETEAQLIHNFTEFRNKKMIISGESIRLLSLAGTKRMRTFMKRYVEKISIVAYIRPPKAYMESAFQQIVKTKTATFNIEMVYPNYKHFDIFFKMFGEENVHLWKFDPSTFPEGNVVLDFCQRLGIVFDPSKVINDNTSISKEALTLLYIYRKYKPDYGGKIVSPEENYRLIQILSRVKGNKVRFSPELIKPILKKHKKDIKWIEKRLSASVDEPLEEHVDSIKSESDLLRISSDTKQILKEILEELGVRGCEVSDDERKIADAIHALWIRIHDDLCYNRSKNKEKEMKIMEIVKEIKASRGEEIGKIPNGKVALIVREFLEKLGEELDKTNEGRVNIPILGSFVIKTVKQEKDGVSEIQKRIRLLRKKSRDDQAE